MVWPRFDPIFDIAIIGANSFRSLPAVTNGNEGRTLCFL
jgi:hypothetical protein